MSARAWFWALLLCAPFWIGIYVGMMTSRPIVGVAIVTLGTPLVLIAIFFAHEPYPRRATPVLIEVGSRVRVSDAPTFTGWTGGRVHPMRGVAGRTGTVQSVPDRDGDVSVLLDGHYWPRTLAQACLVPIIAHDGRNERSAA